MKILYENTLCKMQSNLFWGMTYNTWMINGIQTMPIHDENDII